MQKFIITPVRKLFRFFSSLKTAIPLLVITVVVTIGGSLLPQPDFFKTWWYLGLLGLNGVSLLFVTILHIPLILKRKGRNALIGVVVTHLGILILIIGAIYGGLSGFRYKVKAIEEEMTVVPGLPFVIHLDKLLIEEYSPEIIAGMYQKKIPNKTQDSYLTLIKNGEPWAELITRPGKPAHLDGVTLLPSLNDIGWYFELVVRDPQGRETVIPVKPWSPPIINVGNTPVMAHSLMDTSELSAQIFTMINEEMTPLGVVSHGQPLAINDHTVTLGQYKRYTAISIYNRPQAPVLVLGCLAMLFGLIWHFYHRHRDQKRDNGRHV